MSTSASRGSVLFDRHCRTVDWFRSDGLIVAAAPLCFSSGMDRLAGNGNSEPLSSLASVSFTSTGRYGDRGSAEGHQTPYPRGNPEACEKRDCILQQAAAFASRNYVYDPVPLAILRQVNSNTFIHWVALSCGINLDRPPGSVGWDPYSLTLPPPRPYWWDE